METKTTENIIRESVSWVRDDNIVYKNVDYKEKWVKVDDLLSWYDRKINVVQSTGKDVYNTAYINALRQCINELSQSISTNLVDNSSELVVPKENDTFSDDDINKYVKRLS